MSADARSISQRRHLIGLVGAPLQGLLAGDQCLEHACSGGAAISTSEITASRSGVMIAFAMMLPCIESGVTLLP